MTMICDVKTDHTTGCSQVPASPSPSRPGSRQLLLGGAGGRGSRLGGQGQVSSALEKPGHRPLHRQPELRVETRGWWGWAG